MTDKDNPDLSVKDEMCSAKETDILLPNPNIVIVEEVNDKAISLQSNEIASVTSPFNNYEAKVDLKGKGKCPTPHGMDFEENIDMQHTTNNYSFHNNDMQPSNEEIHKVSYVHSKEINCDTVHNHTDKLSSQNNSTFNDTDLQNILHSKTSSTTVSDNVGLSPTNNSDKEIIAPFTKDNIANGPIAFPLYHSLDRSERVCNIDGNARKKIALELKVDSCHSVNNYGVIFPDIETQFQHLIKERKEKLGNYKTSEIPIEFSLDYSESSLTVTERYFTPRYCVDPNNKVGEDQCILFHSNRICLVTLAPSHPIIAEKKKISKIDFQVTPKLNRMENKPTGKGKRGAQYVQSTSVLCLIDCDDETKYKVSSCLIGKLVEVNEELTRSKGGRGVFENNLESLRALFVRTNTAIYILECAWRCTQIDVHLGEGVGGALPHGQQRATNPGSVECGFCGEVHLRFIVEESERVNWG
uniref:Actin-binding transcription modulator n=1 Tax=Timema shepardi TaxID=629360 RepID=A0A7R9AQ48_TIMSH|nr:unnamed protein product [Timema shepardi]